MGALFAFTRTTQALTWLVLPIHQIYADSADFTVSATPQSVPAHHIPSLLCCSENRSCAGGGEAEHGNQRKPEVLRNCDSGECPRRRTAPNLWDCHAHQCARLSAPPVVRPLAYPLYPLKLLLCYSASLNADVCGPTAQTWRTRPSTCPTRLVSLRACS